jgi:hypothetical protein
MFMMKNFKRRIQAEFGEEIIESNPKVVVLDYKFGKINVVLDEFYPFNPPLFVDTVRRTWNYERYTNIQRNLPYINKYITMMKDKEECIYYKTLLCNGEWTPRHIVDDVVKQFIYLDAFVSNCIKMEFIYRNKLELPDDMVYEIFSYLHTGFS